MAERKELLSSIRKNTRMKQVDETTFIDESDPSNRIMYEIGTKWIRVNRFQRGRWKEFMKHRIAELPNTYFE